MRLRLRLRLRLLRRYWWRRSRDSTARRPLPFLCPCFNFSLAEHDQLLPELPWDWLRCSTLRLGMLFALR